MEGHSSFRSEFGPPGGMPVVWMQGIRHPVRRPCPMRPSGWRRQRECSFSREVWVRPLRGQPFGPEAAWRVLVPPSALGWPFRWNPLGSDVREVTPGSAALPRRPGRRRAAASFVPDGARPEVAFSPEAPTRVSRPSPSTPASRSGSSPRPEANLPSLPNRAAVELVVTPGGSAARRSRWNEGCDLRRGTARADPPVGGPGEGSGLPRPGSFAFWRYRNERPSSRRELRCRIAPV